MESTTYFTKQRIDRFFLWKNKHPLLSRLDMELTERCNNNCLHCYINLPANNLAAKQRELSTKEIKKILSEAADLGCLSVRFTGGEPLLREDFAELYIFARKIGLKVIIFTNATLITSSLVSLFKRILPLEKIEITIYGMKQSSYEAVSRVSGSFDSVWQGINLLLADKIPFIVKGALLFSNKEEIDEFENWASTLPGMDKPPAYSMFLDLRCRRDDMRKNLLINSLRLSPEEGLKLLTRQEDKYVKEMQEFCCKFMRSPGDKLFSCGAGCGSGCVDAYGKLQLCMILRHPETVYDLRNGSLKDALENFFPKIREIKATNPEYLAKCARCFLKGLCEQCPAKSWAEYGTLDTPVDYLCEVAHVQAKYLGLIKEDEKAWQVSDWQERIREFTTYS